VAYSSDLTNAQWNLLEPLLVVPSKRGPKHGADLRHVVDAMLYISHTGCQWRFLPDEFGPWTRDWSQFRRWSRSGTWNRVLTALHTSSRTALGRKERRPSLVAIDTHLARGASNGGVTFHDQGGPYGRTNGAKRIVCVDVTGLPLCVRVVPASTSEASAVEQILDDLAYSGADERLELVRVDRGTTVSAATRMSAKFNYRCAGSDGTTRHATSTGPKPFALSVTLGGSKLPTATWFDAGAWDAASRTPWRQQRAGCTSPPSVKSFVKYHGQSRADVATKSSRFHARTVCDTGWGGG
jgi:putative transposase